MIADAADFGKIFAAHFHGNAVSSNRRRKFRFVNLGRSNTHGTECDDEHSFVNLGRQIGLRNEITLNTFETGTRFVAGCKKRDNTPDFGLQPEELQQLESLFSRFDLHTGKLRTGVTQLKITDFTGENKQSLSGKKRANDLLGEQGRQVTGETQEDAGSAKSRKTDSKVTGEDM